RRGGGEVGGRLEGLPEPVTGLSTTGLLKDEKPKAIEEWIEAAVGAGLLSATDDVYRTLSLTRFGREVMAGRATDVEVTLPEPPAGPPPQGKKKRARPWDENAPRPARPGTRRRPRPEP